MAARPSSDYAVAPMAELLACPFCRELYSQDEQLENCPDCGVALQRLRDLPPSPEIRLEMEAVAEQTPVEHRTRAFWDWRRGRGALVGLSVAGIAAFFLPWIALSLPETAELSGYFLARHFAGWLWGGAVGWFILIPLTLTRRTIAQMRGVRIVTTLFAGLTLAEILLLVSLPATRHSRVPVQFEWQWGLWVSAAISALGAAIATRFGGSLEKSGPTEPTRVKSGVQPASAPPSGTILH